MGEIKEEKEIKTPWWQPGMQLFLRLSAWIVGPILLAILVGKFLDRTFQTEPWLFLATVITAFTISIVMIVRIGLREIDKE